METLKKYFKIEYLLVLVLVVIASYFRFKNLGYSDYIGDEHKAFAQTLSNQTLFNFFMTRRKGPMQFVVSAIPHAFTLNYKNELAQRIPFAFISVGVVLVFYLLSKKITKSILASFIATFLLTVNGFIVGFGRIAQYQNLNLLFSFLTLYFYLDILNSKKNHIKSSLIGTAFYCLSILSHWDAIFILPVILYIWGTYVLNKNIEKTVKINLVKKNFILGCILLLWFLLPYSIFQMFHSANKEYFARRLELGHFNTERYLLLYRLYNPFISLQFLLITTLLGMFFYKKSWFISAWALFGYLVFEFFVRKPGTHIYNFIIPMFILSGMGIAYITKLLPKIAKFIPVLITLVFLGFFAYQTHVIFIDHAREYPWEQKVVLDLKTKPRTKLIGQKKPEKQLIYLETPKYTIDQKLPLFGFPHFRYWNEINKFILAENKKNNEEYGYITNEVKTISEYYMDVKYKNNDGFYIVGIKRPLSFVNDYKFPQIGGKKTVKELYLNDERVVKIYRVEPKR